MSRKQFISEVFFLPNFFSSALVLFLLFVVDRLSKQLALKTLSQGFFILPEVGLELQLNPDLAFSLSLPTWLMYLLLFIVFSGLIYWLAELVRNKEIISAFLVGGLLLGGFSNLLDRIQQGAVIDFIRFYFLPVFNLSDIYIILAIIGLAIIHTKESKQS